MGWKSTSLATAPQAAPLGLPGAQDASRVPVGRKPASGQAPMPNSALHPGKRLLETAVAKAWGTTQVLYRDRQVELTQALICRGGYSSRHVHRFKANAFLVVTGRLLVIRYAEDEPTRRILAPADGLYTVPPGVEHRFLAIEEQTTVYEFYYAAPGHVLRPDDIVRRDQGGRFAGPVDAFAG